MFALRLGAIDDFEGVVALVLIGACAGCEEGHRKVFGPVLWSVFTKL